MRVRQDRVEVEGKGETIYAYAERAESVIIIPVTKDKEVVLVRQYRYPVDEWCLEVPAGGTHDTGNASLDDVVRKELKEEIGATDGRLEHVTFFYPSNSMSNEKCHVYLALDVELSQEPKTEETESIEMQIVPVAEALHLARTGQIKTGPCALALLLCEERLKQHGYL